jgi:hypothetical protein
MKKEDEFFIFFMKRRPKREEISLKWRRSSEIKYQF